MNLITYKKWLYLEGGDVIKSDSGRILEYTGKYEHLKEGMIRLFFQDLFSKTPNPKEKQAYSIQIHKEALLPIVGVFIEEAYVPGREGDPEFKPKVNKPKRR